MAVLICAAPPVLANEIGTTAAVNPATFGTPPDEGRRTLMVGAGVVFRELVETEAGGQTQILFVDESTVTLGPSTRIVLDEFVFDPAAADGTFSISMVKGALRFVGGKISKGGGVAIKTPAATIGIRGGISVTTYDPATGEAGVFCPFGECSLTTPDGETVPVPDSNTLMSVGEDGEIESEELDPEQVTELFNGFQGGDGTVIDETETEVLIAENPESALSSEAPETTTTSTTTTTTTTTTSTTDPIEGECVTCDAVQDNTSNVFTVGGRVMTTPDPYTTDDGGVISDPFAQNIIGGKFIPDNFGFQGAQIDLAAGTISIDLDGNGTIDAVLPIQQGDFAVPTTTVTPPGEPATQVVGSGFLAPSNEFFFYDLSEIGDDVTILVHGGIPTNLSDPALANGAIEAYTLRSDPILGATIPFLSPAIDSNFSNAVISNFLMARQNTGLVGELVSGDFATHTMQTSLAIEGQGVNQKSLLIGTTGAIALSEQTGEPVLSQGIRGSIRLAANQSTIRPANSIGTVPDGEGSHFFGSNLDYFVLDNNDPFTINSNPTNIHTSAQFEVPFVNPPTRTVNGFRHVAEKTTTPFVAGERLNRQMNGYFGALGQSVDLSSGAPGVLSAPYIVSTENASPTSLFIRTDTATNTMFARLRFDTAASTAGGTDITDGELTFGGIGGFRGTYIDEQNFSSRNVGNASSNLGDINGSQGEVLSFSPDGFRSLIVVHDTVGATNFLPAGVTFCDCGYLKWGYWLSEFRWVGGSRRESFHIGTWVAGDLPLEIDMPISGTANFDGHMIGNVYNNVGGANAQYIAVGNFQANWDFSLRTGTFAVTDFDGTDFTNGTVAGIGASRVNFDGTASGTHNGAASGTGAAGNIGMAVNGSFFSGPNSAAEYVGGQAILEDTTTSGAAYRAVTTFAASQ